LRLTISKRTPVRGLVVEFSVMRVRVSVCGVDAGLFGGKLRLINAEVAHQQHEAWAVGRVLADFEIRQEGKELWLAVAVDLVIPFLRSRPPSRRMPPSQPFL
jgi:hypothetical protein